MSLNAVHGYAVPEDTARIARTMFPQGRPVMRVLDDLHMIMADRDFSDLFAARGQPRAACVPP